MIGTAGKLEPDGAFRMNEVLLTILPTAAAKFLRITAAGIRWLKDQHKGTAEPAPAKEPSTLDGNSEAVAAASDMTVVSEKQLKLMIRQQVKAEEKTRLTDDIYVAAYRQEDSYRKAAAYLSQEADTEVSKDQVYRAVNRSGGVQAVLKTEDSDSIQRTVASQGRDRQQRFALPAQPPEIK